MPGVLHTGGEDGAAARSADARLAAIAVRQHGLVSLSQVRGAGLGEGAIAHRVRMGRLHRVRRGVYAVGHQAVSRHGQMLAAVLACGTGAVASHRTAAELHGLYERTPAVFDVISTSQAGRRLDGIRRHRAVDLPACDLTIRDGVPSTNVPRTLVDLAGMLGERSLRSVVEAAAVSRTLDVPEVDRILGRGRRRGAPVLRKLLQAWRETSPTPRLRSRLEARLAAASAEAGLPRPECNVILRLGSERFEIDLLWREQRLAIETDGEETHGTAVAFQRDRRRDQVLVAAGYRTARVTWLQMKLEPAQVLDRIRRMLEL